LQAKAVAEDDPNKGEAPTNSIGGLALDFGDARSSDRDLAMLAGVRARLLPLPHTLELLRDLVQDPVVEVGKLVPVVERDPALTAHLLRLCNSAQFGLSRQVGSVREALVLTGNVPFLKLATSWGLTNVLQSRLHGYGLGREELWRHSLAVAHAASEVIRALGHSQSDGRMFGRAFASGLLHDIGMIVLDETLAKSGATISPALSAQEARELERAAAGMDRDQAGAALVEAWNFPEVMVEAVRWHHQPDKVRGRNALALAVHVGNRISRFAAIGSDGVAPESSLDPLVELGVPEPVIASLLDRLGTATDSLADLVS
jgi:HD-like signal output (HDOD) protein